MLNEKKRKKLNGDERENDIVKILLKSRHCTGESRCLQYQCPFMSHYDSHNEFKHIKLHSQMQFHTFNCARDVSEVTTHTKLTSYSVSSLLSGVYYTF